MKISFNKTITLGVVIGLIVIAVFVLGIVWKSGSFSQSIDMPSLSASKAAPEPVNIQALGLVQLLLEEDYLSALTGSQTSVLGEAKLVKPLHKVSSTTLAAQFEANELVAHYRFGQSTLAVSGYVTGVRENASGKPVIELEGTQPMFDVQAETSVRHKQLAFALRSGDKALLICDLNGYVLQVLHLKNCAPPHVREDAERYATKSIQTLHQWLIAGGAPTFENDQHGDLSRFLASLYLLGISLPADSVCFAEQVELSRECSEIVTKIAFVDVLDALKGRGERWFEWLAISTEGLPRVK
ncbi:hypothetical protein ACIQVE_01630 [Pseudomonas sp. NPDC098747]|uniref:OB-fold protein n=1 Tax=Pseudomonas sp. NPDC098747 TaxID=3364487 RepID=UPI003839EBDF